MPRHLLYWMESSHVTMFNISSTNYENSKMFMVKFCFFFVLFVIRFHLHHNVRRFRFQFQYITLESRDMKSDAQINWKKLIEKMRKKKSNKQQIKFHRNWQTKTNMVSKTCFFHVILSKSALIFDFKIIFGKLNSFFWSSWIFEQMRCEII